MTEPLCIKIDGVWMALPLRSTAEMVVNEGGISISYEALEGSVADQERLGAFRPDPPADPPKGKILTDRTLGGDDRPEWVAIYGDGPTVQPSVPPRVFDYQFAGEAEARGIISKEACDAWVGPGEIPAILLEAVEKMIPDEEARRPLVLFLMGSKEFPRYHPNTEALAPLFGLDTPAKINEFFISASAR